MIAPLGRGLVLLALLACAVGGIVALLSGARRSEQGWNIARWMAITAVVAIMGSTALMEYALLARDFSVAYVAQVGSVDVPDYIAFVSLWSSLEGSILFWGFVLMAYTAGFAVSTRGRFGSLTPYALGIQLLVGVFFTFLIAGVASPFGTMDPVPTSGPGPNPLLQNHLLMVVHPPALYLGYVGMSVPFSMAAGALLAGRLEAGWMRLLRRWMLVPWAFLTLGILLGGWWSYEVLGWGGYWAWDPVENASFLPWLTATAFLHSAQIMERKGQFKVWTLVLAMASFLLTLLGTFMTRSGVFNSVHSFTQSEIGPVFLGFIAVATGFTVVLLSLRMASLAQTSTDLDGVVTRPGLFLANNLLFVGVTFTVLLGTVYPLLNEAVSGERISVGEPYFNQMTLPLWMGVLFLMGVGPVFPWGRPDVDELKKRVLRPGVAAVVGTALALGLGLTNPWGVATVALAVFAGTVSVAEIWAPVSVRMGRGEGFTEAAGKALSRTRRRVAGHVVHLGVVLLAIGIAASSSMRQDVQKLIERGQTIEWAGYELTFDEMEIREEPHLQATVAHVTVGRAGSVITQLEPSMNHYRSTGQAIGTPAVYTGPGEDLYLSVINVEEDVLAIRVLVEPLVAWVWLGGLVMFLGGLLAAWPARASKAPASAEAAA